MRRDLTLILLILAILYGFFSGIGLLTRNDPTYVLFAENGVVDTNACDFAANMYYLSANNWEYYAEQLYEPADFRLGIPQNPSYDRLQTAEYGTFRVRLKLPLGPTYGIAGRSLLYSTRLYIDGQLRQSYGQPGRDKESTLPATGYYTLYFTPQQEECEIIFQVANFHHQDGGGSYPFNLSEQAQITRHTFLRLFRHCLEVGCLVAVFLIFLGLFTFFSRRLYFLYFSFSCLFCAIRQLVTEDKILLELVPLDWFAMMRLEYLDLILLACFLSLYIANLYPKLIHPWLLRLLLAASGLYALVILFSEPLCFTRFLLAYEILLVIDILWIVLQMLRYLRGASLDYILIFAGVVALAIGSINDMVHYAFKIILFDSADMLPTMMMVCVFMNTLALSLQFSRTDTELSDARLKERELNETNLMLDRLNRMKNHFLADISHEMKTPLAVISTYAQLTSWQLRAGSEPDALAENMELVSNEALRMSRMVSDLLALSREQEHQPASEALDLQRILSQIRELYTLLLHRKNNVLVLRLDADLPPVQGNADALVQVFVNLLSNANNHTEDGTITITAGADDAFIHIRICDTGSGIPEERLPYLFERGNADAHKGDSEGSGLGLPICQQIIHSHGGRIEIASQPGQGTEVALHLPHAGRRE